MQFSQKVKKYKFVCTKYLYNRIENNLLTITNKYLLYYLCVYSGFQCIICSIIYLYLYNTSVIKIKNVFHWYDIIEILQLLYL